MATSVPITATGAAFRVVETFHDPDPVLVRGMCTDRDAPPAVAHVVRRAVPRSAVDRLARRFWATVDQGGSHRPDDGYVRVQQIGPTQWGQSAAAYADQCVRTRRAVEDLFAELSADERARVLGDHWLAPYLAAAGVAFGPARPLGVAVTPCTARCWRNDGAFSLEPHEDQAQLLGAMEEEFEIGAAAPLCAWVCCVENSGGGEIVLWDFLPDHRTRAALGLVKTGYPYPFDALHGARRLEIPLQAGDAILFRADLVHAIGEVDGARVSASRFLGALPGRVVYWT